MFGNMKNRFISVIAPDIPSLQLPTDHRRGQLTGQGSQRRLGLQDKFTYARPPFLQLLTNDELRASADHNVRPIIVPRDINLLPWGTGYAECVNSGKSKWNEDQAAFCRQVLSDPTHQYPDLPYTYFGIFDGHAGYGAALAASYQFHHILHEKLVDCIDMLLPRDDNTSAQPINSFPHPSHFQRHVTKDELIIGALENAFFHMDSLIAQDRDRCRDAGGCTACVALFIDGKLYVANAGDSRAVLCQRKRNSHPMKMDNGDENENGTNIDSYAVPLSSDHTPETERHRLLNVARLKPNLCGRHYTAMEYAKRPHSRDLGKRILCRQGTMMGWIYKTLTYEDLRMPVVTGEGKRSRLLGTLGVTRGFGDHELLAINTGTLIKPFLTPHPDVVSRDLTKVVSITSANSSQDVLGEDGDYGILVISTDGLWDVTENEVVARTVFNTLTKYPTEKHRYTMIAQELVARARGKINISGHWRLAHSKAAATVDDISVFVIPVYQYYKEHLEWELRYVKEHQARAEKEAQHAVEAKEDSMSIINGVTIAQTVLEPENKIVSKDIGAAEEKEEIVVELNKKTGQVNLNIEEEKEPETQKSPMACSNETERTSANEKEIEDLIDNRLIAAISTLKAEENDGQSHIKELPHKKKSDRSKRSHKYKDRI